MSDGREPDRELVFYYNRERRLERASPAVRALNGPLPMMKGGFIRSLTSTKSNLLLLISILIIMAFIMILSALHGPRGTLTLGGNTLRLSAGKDGGESSIRINKRISQKEDAPYTGEVYVAVSPVLGSEKKLNPADIPVFTAKLFFTLEREEEYRLVLPFTAEHYLLLFQAGDERSTARVKSLR
ncbi:hypothetical protein FACS1894137_02680 [Spirochaetia bacterium]|nr:hypothetical protein FACS1894137_02680 [Spirochaetia bacterium]